MKRVRYSVRQFGASAFQKHPFLQFLTQFNSISGPPIAFLQVATEINNKNTLKVCRKITKFTDPNLFSFLSNGANLWMKFPPEL